MSLWKTIKDSFKEVMRDEHVDEYLIQLRHIGVDASEVDREGALKGYAGPRLLFEGSYGYSVGLIYLPGSPASFVSVRKKVKKPFYTHQVARYYFTDYLVPDTRLTSKHRRLSVEAKYIRTMEAYGDTVEACWEGEDLSTGLLDRLNGDRRLKKDAMLLFDERKPFKITTEHRRKVWVIRGSADAPPTRDLFDTHQAIAQHLLDTPIQ